MKGYEDSQGHEEDVPCRVMLEVQDFTDDAVFIKTFENDCKTLVKILPENKQTTSQKDIKRELSELMARAWWTVDEGRIDELWDSDWFTLNYACFVRYVVEFDQGHRAIPRRMHISQENFTHYLNTTFYRAFDGKNYTYLAYLTDYSGAKSLVGVLPQFKTPDYAYIDQDKTYAISIMSLHTGSNYQYLLPVAGLGLATMNIVLSDMLPTVVVFSTLNYAREELQCRTVQPKGS